MQILNEFLAKFLFFYLKMFNINFQAQGTRPVWRFKPKIQKFRMRTNTKNNIFNLNRCCVFWPDFGCCAHPKAGQNFFSAVFNLLCFTYTPFPTGLSWSESICTCSLIGDRMAIIWRRIGREQSYETSTPKDGTHQGGLWLIRGLFCIKEELQDETR